MLTDRWQEIESLYHAALERKPGDRKSYLDSACSDPELRREIESLLANDDPASRFLETDKGGRPAPDQDSHVRSGERIGPYVVLEFVRAGGMGEVYKGRDTRLNRTVAIKFLPRASVTDPAALKRFQREARAASALNHPRICTIHDWGEYQAQPFFVMEFLEDESLRDRIANKPLSVLETVDFAAQICDGLQAAHAKDIVHRDIKPANIFVTLGGQVKILDFGLAKLGLERHAPRTPIGEGDETITRATLTRAGSVMGTMAYLSPEQARGEEVDSRTDIFSLGTVMYEMATGRQPFHGETAAELVDKILTANPDKPSKSNAAVPKSLERIIEKALAKDRATRYRSAEELAADLAALTTSRGRRFLVAMAAIAVFAGVALPIWISTQPANAPRPQAFTQLTDNPGEELYPSLAPDRKSFVYQSRASGRWEIYFKRVGEQRPVSLTRNSASDHTQPSFSPDGKSVAFRSEREGGGIFVMGAGGENARRLTTFGYNPSWSPYGKEVVCSTAYFVRPEERPVSPAIGLGKLFRVNIATGEAHAISRIDDAVQPNCPTVVSPAAIWIR
jgi:serine/threonine protein kinase